MAVLVDTGPLLALADADDPHHQAVSQWIEETLEVLLVPVTVLPEADYLLASRLGADVALAMLRSVAAGELQLEPLMAADLERAIALIAQYADSNIGFVDASIAAIAERLRVTRILTLDHRHFRLLRPLHCDAFELLPPAI